MTFSSQAGLASIRGGIGLSANRADQAVNDTHEEDPANLGVSVVATDQTGSIASTTS